MLGYLKTLTAIKVGNKTAIGMLAAIALIATALIAINSSFLLASLSIATVSGPQASIDVFKVSDIARTSGLAPFTILFNAKSSSGNIVRHEWNFNDSNVDYPSTDEGRMVGHRFDNPGTYNVRLTVYDENGQSASSQITITALSQPAGALTYYVSMSGSSANDGLSPNTPWNLNKILVKNTSFIPDGSQILFKRGDDFTTATSSFEINDLLRSAPNYLTLDAYGAGEKPIFGPITTYGKNRYSNKGIIIQNLQARTIKIYPYYSAGFVSPGLQVALRNLKINNGDIHIWQSDGITLENTHIDRHCDTAANPTDPVQCDGIGLAVTTDDPPFSSGHASMGYFYVNKLEIDGAKSHGVYFAGAYHDVLVENSNFHDNGIYGLRDGFTAHGWIDNLILRRNQIHDNYFAIGLDSAYLSPRPAEYMRNIIIENNQIYNQKHHLIQIRSLQNSIFRNNLIYNNNTQAGHLFWLAGPKVDGDKTVLDEPTNNIGIYNNTLYNNIGPNNPSTLYLGVYSEPVTSPSNSLVSNVYFKNNIAVANTGKVLRSFLPNLGTVFMGSNIYSGVLTKPAIDINSQSIDPLLVNPASLDFRLQAGSPAINAGASVNAKYDFSHNLRDSSLDIGAYENSSAPPPPPPADVTKPITGADPVGGAYSAGQIVTLTVDEPATIYYCLGSGCSPTAVYSSPITVSQPATLRFYAKDSAGNIEATKEEVYAIQTVCIENWTCTRWSVCKDGLRIRSCTDLNSCGTANNKPLTSQTCRGPK